MTEAEKSIETLKDPELVGSEESILNESQSHISEVDADAETAKLAAELGINHKKLMWKIDVCVVPPFCLLYFFSFLDELISLMLMFMG